MVNIEKIDRLLDEWNDTENDFSTLSKKRDELEKQIISIMVDNIWKDYKGPKGIHASLVEEEESHIDMNQLSVLLSKSDFESVTRYTSRRNLVIMTPDGKKRLRKMLRL